MPKIKKLRLECDGVTDMAITSHRNIRVYVENVCPSFIRDLEPNVILMNTDNIFDIIDLIDEKELKEYLRNRKLKKGK